MKCTNGRGPVYRQDKETNETEESCQQFLFSWRHGSEGNGGEAQMVSIMKVRKHMEPRSGTNSRFYDEDKEGK